MPLICAAWSVASCSAPVSRGDAEPTASAPVSPTPETSAPELRPADVVKRYLNAGARD